MSVSWKARRHRATCCALLMTQLFKVIEFITTVWRRCAWQRDSSPTVVQCIVGRLLIDQPNNRTVRYVFLCIHAYIYLTVSGCSVSIDLNLRSYLADAFRPVLLFTICSTTACRLDANLSRPIPLVGGGQGPRGLLQRHFHLRHCRTRKEQMF